MDSEDIGNKKYKRIITHSRVLGFYYIFLGVIGFAMIMLPIIFYNTSKIDSIGTIGDAVGGMLNPIIAIGAALLTFLAFYIQFQANIQVKKQFEIQQFESQFYEMIRLHKENINEMKITGYDKITIQSFTRDSTGSMISIEDSYSKDTRFTEGRKVFVTMITELIACYEILELCDSIWSTKIPKNALFELAWQFFFFGSESELIWSRSRKARKRIDDFRTALNDIRNRHKNSLGEDNKYKGLNNKDIKLYIKYLPFSGHENRLGHYYRHLFSTVKYVVQKEKEDLFKYPKSREYLKLLRSQMSNYEQLLLYYNYIAGFGERWGTEGYLTNYRMLHNLPISKVKYVQHPRKHFKKYIDTIKFDNDPMFEWGDK